MKTSRGILRNPGLSTLISILLTLSLLLTSLPPTIPKASAEDEQSQVQEELHTKQDQPVDTHGQARGTKTVQASLDLNPGVPATSHT